MDSVPPPAPPPAATPTPGDSAFAGPARALSATLVCWLSLATLHRALLLGRYHAHSAAARGQFQPLPLSSARLGAYALLNGLATDLASYLLLVGPFLALAFATSRLDRLKRITERLPWVGVGLLTLALLFNVLSYRHTEAPINFLSLAMPGNASSALDFMRREAGGWAALLGVVGAAVLLPAAGGFLLSRRIPPPSRRSLAALGVLFGLVILYVVHSAFGVALSGPPLVELLMIREYEDPGWRLFTGALWTRLSPDLPRDLDPREMALLRPVLIPGDSSPPLRPDYPVFRPFHPQGPTLPGLTPAHPVSVVLVLMESSGASDFGAFGDPGGITPRFDALAREGLLFTRFYSNAVDSEAALMATLGSAYPPTGTRRGMVVPDPSLPTILARRGYAAGVVISKWQPTWDVLAPYLAAKEVEVIPVLLGSEAWGDDREVFGKALQWIGSAHRPYFLVVFTMTHHSPWRLPVKIGEPAAPDEWGRSRQALRYQDEALGSFVAALDAAPPEERPLLVLLGDHGSHLAPGETVVVSGLRERDVHVPLLLRRPGSIPAGRSEVLGSDVDVAPTLADFLGLEGEPTAFLGASLFRGGQGRVFTGSIYGDRLYGLIRDDLKVVYSPYLGQAIAYRTGSDEPIDVAPAVLQRRVGELTALNRLSGWLERGGHLAPARE